MTEPTSKAIHLPKPEMVSHVVIEPVLEPMTNLFFLNKQKWIILTLQ